MSTCASAMVNAKLDERGMSIAELARRADVEYERVRGSLVEDRKMLADEFLRYCKVLGITSVA